MGQAIHKVHLRNAKRSSSGLAFLDAETDGGRAYLADVEWARMYATQSRQEMAFAAARVAEAVCGVKPLPDTFFACDHNHVREETHFGEALWVHRKGAASAGAGEPGIIPGSMGTESYHV